MEKRQLTEDEATKAGERAMEYLNEIIEVYNRQLHAVQRTPDQDIIESSAILNTIFSSTLAVLASMAAGKKEDLQELLTDHIDALDKALDTITNVDEGKYMAAVKNVDNGNLEISNDSTSSEVANSST
jgi:hypothetical protein